MFGSLISSVISQNGWMVILISFVYGQEKRVNISGFLVASCGGVYVLENVELKRWYIHVPFSLRHGFNLDFGKILNLNKQVDALHY